MTPQKVGNDGLVLSRDSRAHIGIGASIKEPLDETKNCVGCAHIPFERLSHQLLQHSTLFGDRLPAASLADGDALGELLSEVGLKVARSTRPAARIAGLPRLEAGLLRRLAVADLEISFCFIAAMLCLLGHSSSACIEGVPGLIVESGLARGLLPASYGDVDIAGVELKCASAPPGTLGGQEYGAAAAEGVEHEIARRGAIEHGVGEETDRA